MTKTVTILLMQFCSSLPSSQSCIPLQASEVYCIKKLALQFSLGTAGVGRKQEISNANIMAKFGGLCRVLLIPPLPPSKRFIHLPLSPGALQR